MAAAGKLACGHLATASSARRALDLSMECFIVLGGKRARRLLKGQLRVTASVQSPLRLPRAWLPPINHFQYLHLVKQGSKGSKFQQSEEILNTCSIQSFLVIETIVTCPSFLCCKQLSKDAGLH